MPLGTHRHQGPHSHEVVGGRREGHDPIDERPAPMAQLPLQLHTGPRSGQPVTSLSCKTGSMVSFSLTTQF